MVSSPEPHWLHGLSLLRQSARAAQLYIARSARRERMLVSDFNALSRIADQGMLTPSQLAASLTLDSSSVTELADRLENAGLIKRERVPTDRRAVALRATARGKRRMTRAHKELNAALGAAFQDMTPEELAVVSKFLGNLQKALTDVTERIS